MSDTKQIRTFIQLSQAVRLLHTPGVISVCLQPIDTTIKESEADVIFEKYGSKVIEDHLGPPMKKFGELLFKMSNAGYIYADKEGLDVAPNLNRQKPWTPELTRLLKETKSVFEKLKKEIYMNEKGEIIQLH